MENKFMWRFLFTPTRVIDGDTIEGTLDRGHNIFSQKLRVRLIGINTPELHSKIEEERIAAQAAKTFVSEALVMGKEYVFESCELDAFGRSLGLIYLDENLSSTLNDLILQKGLAKPFKK